MEVFFRFKRQNLDFNKEYADTYHLGKESVGNYKYEYDKGFTVYHVNNLKIFNNIEQEFHFENNTEVPYQFIVFNLKKFQWQIDEEIFECLISQSLIKKVHKIYLDKYDKTRIYIYLRNDKEFKRFGSNVYLNIDEIPSEIKI